MSTERSRSSDFGSSSRSGHVPPQNTPADAHSLSPNVPRSRSTHLGAEDQPPNRRQSLPGRSLPEPNLPHMVDLRNLTYIDDVDENLVCPICRVPLVDPVDTECAHTFCKECINEALRHSDLCPIDRHKLKRPAPVTKAHKIVCNQLDSLLVKCHCCLNPVPRSMLQNHLERYCKDALVKCAGKTCQEVVSRKLHSMGCLHYNVVCPDCDYQMTMLSLSEHREYHCKERHKPCDHCGGDILRVKENIHIERCQYVLTSCRWVEYGCDFMSIRKDLHHHAEECAFKLVGPVAEMLKKEIHDLRTEVRTLTEKDQIQERRIKFLEGGIGGQRDIDRPLDYADLPSQVLTSLADSSHAEPLDSGHEYLLSLVEAQETKVDRISAGMTELEAKQTMMLFNETIQIKNELNEMRSSQQVLSMHVRWLLNFRRQENQRRFGAGPSAGGSDGGGSSSEMSLGRRLSDVLVTKL